jgi:hypothetical protein
MYRDFKPMNRLLAPYRLAMVYALTFISMHLFAQTPTHYPTGQNKVDFSFINIIIYIVFPVLLVGIWLLIRKRKKQD